MVEIGAFAQKIINLRESLNELEISGIKNIKLVDGAYELCNDILQNIREAIEQYENESNKTADEVGEENAE